MENKIRICGFVVTTIIVGVLISFYSDNISNEPSSTAVSVPFTKLAQGTQSIVSARTNYLITSTSELEKLWKMIDAKESPPAIDFTKNSVAAIFAGAVSKVEDTDVRTVIVALAMPDGRCLPKNATTTPYELITLPSTSLAFTHKDQTVVTACEQ
ncbi:hypothetical protein A2609_03550 [Candidatus Kaiserbacteria bacterium RIFOXYD1_FULL_47_14]|uniref:PrcB C-terminal domain-containing protein n=1 Tax=Candidatus Kaiserbacteria bacterium RIFOXYD1_FULL_47_14 TaxID=1798533 RepID=A0A1F6G460_9BACT|nr:MAG: hypothetical protein A2609_03550 [Candidatus Kaiserbacteria bacterium RIFOXYD1_FULL_47_14]